MKIHSTFNMMKAVLVNIILERWKVSNPPPPLPTNWITMSWHSTSPDLFYITRCFKKKKDLTSDKLHSWKFVYLFRHMSMNTCLLISGHQWRWALGEAGPRHTGAVLSEQTGRGLGLSIRPGLHCVPKAWVRTRGPSLGQTERSFCFQFSAPSF